ncbi:hypothetical protein LXL04_037374 [Taraxacum kok-saghyz]
MSTTTVKPPPGPGQLIGRLNHGENRRQKKNADVINNKAKIGTLQEIMELANELNARLIIPRTHTTAHTHTHCIHITHTHTAHTKTFAQIS